MHTLSSATGIAYESHGSRNAVVLLHGLTFDRTTWQPITAELDGAVRTIAVDLPAHGESPGPPRRVDELAECVHDLLGELDVVSPLVIGHSFGAAVASMYAARYPSLGVVMIDSGPEQRSFAELVQRAAPMLRGPGFGEAWAMIESSLGLELIPEPTQTLVRAAHRVDQEVLLGYWEQLLSTPPAQFQAYVDTFIARIDVPVLAVYGHSASDGDRQRFGLLPDVQVEEYPGEGHFVHLVNPARFAAGLRRFLAHCTTAPEGRGRHSRY